MSVIDGATFFTTTNKINKVITKANGKIRLNRKRKKLVVCNCW